jgi:hypothetical protein
LAARSPLLLGDIGVKLELRQILDHDAGAPVEELIGVSTDTDTDNESEPPSLASLDTGQGILHYRGSGRSNMESSRRGKKDRRIGLAWQLEVLGVYSVDDGIEQICDVCRPD